MRDAPTNLSWTSVRTVMRWRARVPTSPVFASMQFLACLAKLSTPRQLVVTTATPEAIASITGIPHASYLKAQKQSLPHTLEWARDLVNTT